MSSTNKLETTLPHRPAFLNQPDGLGTIAYRHIDKQFKKTIKQKSRVLDDTDPESLHQMRVSIRRLRTVLSLFDTAVQLPELITDRHLAQLAKVLGKVRDLDVLMSWFQRYGQEADLSDDERTVLNRLHRKLDRKRQRYFQRMRKYLKGNHYKTLVKAFKAWLDQPQGGANAAVPLKVVLPDLLLPLVSTVFQHPGWFVATKVDAKAGLRPLKRMSVDRINHYLDTQGPLLHDLRKRLKHVRYQAELFLGQYDLAFAAQVKEFRQLQDTLGILQDEAIISDFLSQTLGQDWSAQLPSLAQQFAQERRQTWRQWQALQAQYLDPVFRQRLRQQINSPAR